MPDRFVKMAAAKFLKDLEDFECMTRNMSNVWLGASRVKIEDQTRFMRDVCQGDEMNVVKFRAQRSREKAPNRTEFTSLCFRDFIDYFHDEGLILGSDFMTDESSRHSQYLHIWFKDQGAAVTFRLKFGMDEL